MRHNAVFPAHRGDSAIKHGIAAVTLIAVDLQIQSAFCDLCRIRIHRGIQNDESTRAVSLEKILPQGFKNQLLKLKKCTAVAVKFGKGHIMFRKVMSYDLRCILREMYAHHGESISVRQNLFLKDLRLHIAFFKEFVFWRLESTEQHQQSCKKCQKQNCHGKGVKKQLAAHGLLRNFQM